MARRQHEIELYREERRELARERQEARRQALAERRAMVVRARHHLADAPDERIQRVEIVDPGRASLWTGLAVGISIAALAGVIVAVLLKRRDGGSPAPMQYMPVAVPLAPMAAQPASPSSGLGDPRTYFASLPPPPPRFMTTRHPRFADE